MTTPNINQLKTLFDEACQTTPPSVLLALMFNGRSINKAKRSLIAAIRLIDKSPVNVASSPSDFASKLLSLGEKIDEPNCAGTVPSTHYK